MRLVLDACVLFPTVMREMLVGAAAAGGYEPLWSARILEEWARATRRLPEGAEGIARAEIALLRARWPAAEVAAPPDSIAALDLPDPDDRHVLAAAIAGGAAGIVTRNRADFPARALAQHCLGRRDPDGLLWELAGPGGCDIGAVAEAVRLRAETASGRPQPMRRLLKRAGLPRLAKALAGSTGR